MRPYLALVMIVLTGCVTEPPAESLIGVGTNIICKPDGMSYSSERFPRVALSDSKAFVETTFGITEYVLQPTVNEGTGVKYSWSTSATEAVELSVDANGRGLMFAADPRMYGEPDMRRKAYYFAAVINGGTHLICNRVR